MEKRANRLSPVKKAAYGIGSIGDSLSYNIFYSFFIYFMTTFAGVRPSVAGTISFIAVAWDAITDPFIGHCSDYCKSARGRRIPFILFGSIPLGLSIFALFVNPDLPMTGKAIYYVIVNIIFWVAFTCVDIPYIALGAEITDDYDERIKIRTWARVFMSIGDIAIVAGTLPLVDKIAVLVGDEAHAWTIVGGIVGFLSAVTFFLSGWFLRKSDKPIEKTVVAPPIKEVLIGYKQVFKINEYRKVVGISLLANLIIGIGASSNIFLWKYTFEFDTVSISLIGLVSTVFCLFATFLAAFIATHLGKKQSMMTAFMLIIAGLLVLYFGPRTLLSAILAQIIKLCGISMFWTVIFPLNYDIVEIDEFINGKRREGVLVSFNSLFMKFGVSIGMWISGIMMELFNIDPTLAHQTAEAISNLNIVGMIVPIIIAIVGIVLVSFYRVNKKNFDLLKTALEAKKQGEVYSTDGFDRIIK